MTAEFCSFHFFENRIGGFFYGIHLSIFYGSNIFREDTIIFKELLTNEQITAKEIRLIGVNGEQIGIVSNAEAKQEADKQGLDLVMMSLSNGVAVCKILDYGKYKFDAIKKEKELKKNQKVTEVKEIQLSMTIDKRDLEIKAKKGLEFLNNGNKLKVSLRMSGRQQAYSAKAIEVVKNFCEMMKTSGTPDKEPEHIGRNIIVIVSPNKK